MALRKLNSAIASIETFCEVYPDSKSLLISEAFRDLLAARIHLTHSIQQDLERAPTERPAPLRLVK
jgi:hypothetical protein